jgi:integrase
MARTKRRTHGEGTVYEKRPGYWAAQIRCRGQRITASGETADVARRNLQAKLDSLDESGRPAAADWTVGAFLTIWIDELRATEALKPSTWRRYEVIVRRYLIPGLGGHRLSELSKHDLAAFIRDARSGLVSPRGGGSGPGETTLHHIHAVLRVALESAVQQDLIEHNVAKLLKAPSVRHRPKVILDGEQAARLVRAARGEPFGAAVILGIATGMREGEILGLRRNDLKLREGEVLVTSNAQDGYSGKRELVEPKTEAGKRAIPLPDFAVEALREHLAAQDPPSLLVFPSASGEPIRRDRFLRSCFYPILRKAGLPQMPFHDLRHSAATMLMEMEVDAGTVSKMLGHASPSITLNLYGHVTSTMKRRAAAKVQQLIGGHGVGGDPAAPNGSQMAANSSGSRAASGRISLT